MELLYNPDRMPEEEIKATFVAREQLVDELVALVEGQPDGAGVQHAVIIAPRGMGKTTVLLMVKFALKDRGFGDRWQAVKFPEESYGIYDLADFWVETLYLIAADTADTELRQLADSLKTKYPKSDELQEAAYAALKDWRRKHGRRLLLLVENFDQILEQINDERDNARLRDALMNDDTVMFLGGATTFFKEARAYDQPLYNFFKIYNLYDLKFAQMQELLRRRAELDRIIDFEDRLQQNASRLRALEYFTGGNPRLVLMLYRVVSRSDVTEVRRALEKLLDEVTPYYKAKVEALPAQQRKILDHIARISAKTNEGLTPGEIAAAVRLSPNQVSAQLKRLSELGYVQSANLRGRSSYYTLSEPLYAIWHQMRFGRDARERMGWLISFLKIWYAAGEFGPESVRLEARFRVCLDANLAQEAQDVLEHHHYLVRAMEKTPEQIDVMNRLICSYLDFGDIEIVKKELLNDVNLDQLSSGTIARLRENGCISSTHPSPFDKLLAWFDSDRDLAGQKYLTLHSKLVTYFRHRDCADPEDLTDKTLDLVVRRLESWPSIKDLFPYCYRVAHYVFLDWFEKQGLQMCELPEQLSWVDSDEQAAREQMHACLEYSLSQISSENRELLLQYYQDEGRSKIGRRKALAEKLGISLNALHIRMHRLRSILEEHINKCLDQRQKVRTIRDLPDDWSDLARYLTFQLWAKRRNEAGGLHELDRIVSSQENWEEYQIREQLKDLLAVIRAGNLSLARQLILESNIEDRLFPVAQAIDYLQTGDESLIEKLSPEVRGIVEEVVAKLKTTSQTGS